MRAKLLAKKEISEQAIKWTRKTFWGGLKICNLDTGDLTKNGQN